MRKAGADMIFPEAMNKLEQYAEFTKVVKVPVLANITEFGATPLYTTTELAGVGVKLVLYPLSAFRAMCKAAAFIPTYYKTAHKRMCWIRCKPAWSFTTQSVTTLTSKNWMRYLLSKARSKR